VPFLTSRRYSGTVDRQLDDRSWLLGDIRLFADEGVEVGASMGG